MPKQQNCDVCSKIFKDRKGNQEMFFWRLITSYVLFPFMASNALSVENLIFVIISQNNNYNIKLANELKNDIKNASTRYNLGTPKIFTLPTDFTKGIATWTILPIFPYILDRLESNIHWVFFLEDRTKMDLKLLLETLEMHDLQKEMWIGHALIDEEATIIHHFAFFKNSTFFKYPNFASGFAVTIPLLQRLSHRIQEGDYEQIDFHIDPSHELAMFIWDNGNGPILQHESKFCTKEAENCATFPQRFQQCADVDVVAPSQIYFAIKTCNKFHKSRAQVVKSTWASYTENVLFFSELKDDSIPTIEIGVQNVEQGHCGKTLKILQYVHNILESQGQIKWIALVDDDTILSVSRLSKLLTCFNSTAPMMLGERYRFSDEYDYLTGGAGIIFNREAVAIVQQNCRCPKINSPDDMILGMCARANGISLVHLPYFHQARPVDYSSGYLDADDAVTFHKHWMLDPIQIYDQFFRKEDEAYFEENKTPPTVKHEDL